MSLRSKLALVIILAIASLVRLYKLTDLPASLFSDEVDIGYQVVSIKQTFSDYSGNRFPLQFHSFSDTRTAIPIYLTALVSYLPGVSVDLAIRVVPAVAGILGVLVTFFLLRNFFQIRTALLTSTILALTPWHLTYSRVGFELTLLYLFITSGLYFLTNKRPNNLTGVLLLSLTPAIYSTAKLTIVFLFPLVYKLTRSHKLSILLILPMLALTVSGGVADRFKYISIFTDPVIGTQVDYARLADLGASPQVGSNPPLISKLIYNKPLYIFDKFVRNLFGPLSTQFLFLSGDSNMRHSVPGFGMLLIATAMPLLLGIYSLRGKLTRTPELALVLICLVFGTLVPSAITRDGGGHASRNFLLLLPLIIIICVGLERIPRRFGLDLLAVILVVANFVSYYRFYTTRYQIESAKDFHYGLKQIFESADYSSPLIVSDGYEPPLIFYLYYSHFPVTKAQSLIRENQLLIPVSNDTNLSGIKINGTDVYFVRPVGEFDTQKLTISGNYYLTPADTKFRPLRSEVISLPDHSFIFYHFQIK